MGPIAAYAHESAKTRSEIIKEPFIDLAGVYEGISS